MLPGGGTACVREMIGNFHSNFLPRVLVEGANTGHHPPNMPEFVVVVFRFETYFVCFFFFFCSVLQGKRKRRGLLENCSPFIIGPLLPILSCLPSNHTRAPSPSYTTFVLVFGSLFLERFLSSGTNSAFQETAQIWAPFRSRSLLTFSHVFSHLLTMDDGCS